MNINICCNNGENGIFSGKAIAIEFDGLVWESNGIKITDSADYGYIKIHGKKFKYYKMKEWVGNWCWNQYSFDSETGLKLLDLIRKNKSWYESDI